MKPILKILIFIFFMIYLLISISFADTDKNGLKPQVIKLPSGPGSIEGLGESFEPQLNSGTASYNVPLSLPPGRAGFSPSLSLMYNGGKGNGVLGIGWKLSISYIQRQTDKGLPVYNDTKDSFITSNGEELVHIGNGIYRCENENTFNQYQRLENGWKVSHKNGATSFYGIKISQRIQNDEHIFLWSVCRQVDPNGNEIFYHYNEEDAFQSTLEPGDLKLYLTSITYNHNMNVKLYYEKRQSNDCLFDYRSRFPVQTSFRCCEIKMRMGDQTIRSYQLSYDPQSVISRLVKIELFGKDKQLGPLPSRLTFKYTDFQLNSELSIMNKGINPPVGLLLANADLIDMNGDALPDLLYTGDRHEIYINSDGFQWLEVYTSTQGFGEIKLQHPNTMLMDMNGDGASDLFFQDISINGYRYYKANQSTMEWDSYPVEMADSPNFTFSNITKPVDLDNDGCTDVIRKGEFSDQITCIFNQKGKSWSALYAFPSPSRYASFNFGDEKTSALRLADMNGDSIQDFVVLFNEGNIWYFPGRGITQDSSPEHYQGWDATPRGAWKSSDPTAEGYKMLNAPDHYDEPDFYEWSKFRQLKLLDANADGLSDLVYISNNRVICWLNYGGHSFSAPYSITSTDAHPIPYLNAKTAIRTVDMNANGSTDIVWNCQQGFNNIDDPQAKWVYLDLTKGIRPNLLIEIQNGIGKKTSITYNSSTHYLVKDRINGKPWKYSLPIPINVVSSIDVYDGRNSTYTRKLTYHNGYYDGIEKEFRGFEQAELYEAGDKTAPTLINAYTYHTGANNESLKGKPLGLEAKTVHNDTFYKETYEWKTNVLFSEKGMNDRKVTFPYQSKKVRTIIEKGKGVPVSLKWEYEYDNFGNTTRQIEYGRLDDGWDDERITVNSYSSAYSSGVSCWNIDKLVERYLTDENNTIVSHTRHFYDNSLEAGHILKGNLTRVEKRVKENQYIISERHQYDNYGNITATYDPLYGKSKGHYRVYVYDSLYHSYPIQETIYTGKDDVPELSIYATYDYGLGVVTTSTDFNGYMTSYRYDNYGRLIEIVKPGKETPKNTEPEGTPTLIYQYVLGHQLPNQTIINWVETKQRDDSKDDGFLISRIFYDGLGRKIMTRSEGELAGQVVVTDTIVFNSRKTAWKNYLPYFETGTLDFQEPTYHTGFTEHFYDALGREVRMNQPIGDEGIRFSTTEYEPMVKTVRDEEQTNPASIHYGCGMRYIEDGLFDDNGNGRLRQVYEIVKLSDTGEKTDTPTEWLTQYSYNLLDKLTGYTDSQNNQKFMDYDSLGRKIFLNDPDRGKMHYEYDEADNLTQTIDAKKQVVKYTYDGANRLIAEYYGDKAEPGVEYHYDTPFGPLDRGDLWKTNLSKEITRAIIEGHSYNDQYDLNNDHKINVADVIKALHENIEWQGDRVTSENTTGLLSWVKDQSGEEHRSYDNQGRVQWIVKRIIQNDELKNYYSETHYDDMDRVIKRYYPDNTWITYQYNSRGLLEKIPRVIDQYDYNPAGQNALLSLACGTTTSYAYDHRLRLQRLSTVRLRDQLLLQDLHYTYDGVSNILIITDSRESEHLKQIAQELEIDENNAHKYNATQSFIYDSLYRLTQASNPDVYGTIQYRYDRIGNMISKHSDLLEPDPLMDLGTINSGGDLGAWNRVGRSEGDPPGPHSISNLGKNSLSTQEQYSYDDNGNLTEDRNITLKWDSKDRLIQSNKDDVQTNYLYDYTDNRKKKSVQNSSSKHDYIYINKYSEIRGNELVKYIYAGKNRIARNSATQKTIIFYLNDHIGSTVFALSNNGVIQSHQMLYPFGLQRLKKSNTNSQTDEMPYIYTGKEKDLETGYYYFGKRYYAPHISSFLSTDQTACYLDGNKDKQISIISKPSHLNTYVYSSNSPFVYFDIDGLWQVFVIAEAHAKVKSFTLLQLGGKAAYDSEKGFITEFQMKYCEVDLDIGPEGFAAGTSVKTEIKTGAFDLEISLKGSGSFGKESNGKVELSVKGTVGIYRVQGSVAIDLNTLLKFEKEGIKALGNTEITLAAGVGKDAAFVGAETLIGVQFKFSEMEEALSSLQEISKKLLHNNNKMNHLQNIQDRDIILNSP